MELNATAAGTHNFDPCFAAAAAVASDLLDFNFDAGVDFQPGASASSSSMESEFEDLEWLSNKEAFPSVEGCCFGILAENPELMLNHHSPVSVLENSSGSSNSNTSSKGNGNTVASYCSSLKVPESFPVRSRSKRPRRKRSGLVGFSTQQCLQPTQVSMKNKQEPSILLPTLTTGGAGMGRRCLHCQADKTPQWRAGPMGPKTLCNACGVRYKSGRLLPEYRPASSPTFSTVLHSNSHRKVVEMRKKKQLSVGGGLTVSESCGYIG